jgi:cell division control protein 6
MFRQEQVQAIARCVQGVARGQPPQNVFIHGPTGTGKTTSSRLVLSELSEFTEKAVTAYVNCWENYSRQAVFSTIADQVGEALPKRGIGADEIFSRIVQRLKYDRKTCIIVLDEADRVATADTSTVLYELSRAAENHGVSFGLILVSNVPDLAAGLDSRIRSSLRLEKVEFKKYLPSQLKEILYARAKDGFLPGAASDDIIGLCAAFGAKAGGDARVALEALWKAGRNAEKRGANKIEESDVRASLSESGEWKKKQRLSGVSEPEGMVLDLLAKHGEMASGELYEKYIALNGETERQIRNYVNALEKRKLVSVREAFSESGRGKTRLVKAA